MTHTLRCRAALCLAFCWFTLSARFASGSTAKRPVEVRDSIESVRFGTPLEDFGGVQPPLYSPSRDRFVVLIRKGLVEANVNRYTVLLFTRRELPGKAVPQVLFHLDIARTGPAVDQLRWLPDGKSLLFVGANGTRTRQVYAFELAARRLRRLTSATSDVVAYDLSRDRAMLVYLTRPAPPKPPGNEAILVTDQSIPALLGAEETGALQHFRLFAQRRGLAAREIALNEDAQPENGIHLSPDGRSAVLSLLAENRPAAWSRYRFASATRWITRYMLVDFASGKVEPVLDAPSDAYTPEVAWSADSRSVVLGSAYLPLDGTPERLGLPADREMVLAVRLSGRHVTPVTGEPLHVTAWNSKAGWLILSNWDNQPFLYTAQGDSWKRVGPYTDPAEAAEPYTVQRERGSTQPDRLMVTAKSTGEKRVLLDPNPQYADLQFGELRPLTWNPAKGAAVQAGLYLPVGYEPGKRYPLVIQTHGWNPRQFWIDGASNAGYAAQALAGKGFAVVQVEAEDEAALSTPSEGPAGMAILEGLIDELDRQGIVDLKRVGLLGWSRSGYVVRYTLTHSARPFAAAVIADGYDDGYLHYLTRLPLGAAEACEYEGVIGTAPFGEGRQAWLEHASGFNLDRVRTPMRLLGFAPASLLLNWEWFVGLQRLGKPVEFVWLPNAGHDPELPSDRMTAQEGDVDWFRFWLQGEKDPSPAKRDEYARWEKLRAP